MSTLAQQNGNSASQALLQPAHNQVTMSWNPSCLCSLNSAGKQSPCAADGSVSHWYINKSQQHTHHLSLCKVEIGSPLHLSVPESESWAVDQSHIMSLVPPGESVVEMKYQQWPKCSKQGNVCQEGGGEQESGSSQVRALCWNSALLYWRFPMFSAWIHTR